MVEWQSAKQDCKSFKEEKNRPFTANIFTLLEIVIDKIVSFVIIIPMLSKHIFACLPTTNSGVIWHETIH